MTDEPDVERQQEVARQQEAAWYWHQHWQPGSDRAGQRAPSRNAAIA